MDLHPLCHKLKYFRIFFILFLFYHFSNVLEESNNLGQPGAGNKKLKKQFS